MWLTRVDHPHDALETHASREAVLRVGNVISQFQTTWKIPRIFSGQWPRPWRPPFLAGTRRPAR